MHANLILLLRSLFRLSGVRTNGQNNFAWVQEQQQRRTTLRHGSLVHSFIIIRFVSRPRSSRVLVKRNHDAIPPLPNQDENPTHSLLLLQNNRCFHCLPVVVRCVIGVIENPSFVPKNDDDAKTTSPFQFAKPVPLIHSNSKLIFSTKIQSHTIRS